jgi:lipopolysaccharide heptosyltransferase II
MRDTAIDWSRVRRVLVVRLRSIGDTVLATPSLIALDRFLPDAQIDILLEDWVASVLDGVEFVDNIVTVGDGILSRIKAIREIRRARYDVVFNLHGGTTATLFTFLSGSKHRVGYSSYQYSFLYDHLLPTAADFWQRDDTHSAEHQLALLGFVGVPVHDRPRSALAVNESAAASVRARLREAGLDGQPYALIHPIAAYKTKQWAMEKFARTADFLRSKGISSVAVGSAAERDVLASLQTAANVQVLSFTDLTIPELVALASNARVFVGNDSGVAHIAAAVQTPSVVVFGSSSRDHWGPWTDAPSEMVFEQYACQPCAGRECREFGEPRCILTLPEEKVFAAIDRMLDRSKPK